ncbi:MAG: MBL fold metallo-hydrolase [Desulfobacterales bacterium]|jgi:glyoxylase-like metal-dependent hydrolase (beta-lactamase superfamily II)
MNGRARQITGEIYQVGGGELTADEDAAVYLVWFGQSGALIDAGCGRRVDALIHNIRSVGFDPEAIECLLITHCHFDHTGGAAELRARLGAVVVAHELDAEFLESGDDRVTAASWYGSRLAPLTVDRKLTGEQETITISGREIMAVHVPGHSPGSVVYLTESEGKRILFAQDVHGPLHPDLRSNQADYRRSLERMLALEPDILCEGHYGVVFGQAGAAAFIRSFL